MSMGARRLVAKMVLFLAVTWVALVVVTPMPLLYFLTPGCVFVPAAYYAVRLHRDDESDRSWRLMAVLAACGIVALIAAGHQVGL